MNHGAPACICRSHFVGVEASPYVITGTEWSELGVHIGLCAVVVRCWNFAYWRRLLSTVILLLHISTFFVSRTSPCHGHDIGIRTNGRRVVADGMWPPMRPWRQFTPVRHTWLLDEGLHLGHSDREGGFAGCQSQVQHSASSKLQVLAALRPVHDIESMRWGRSG